MSYTNRLHSKEATMRRTQGYEKLLANRSYKDSQNSLHYMYDDNKVVGVVLITNNLNDLSTALGQGFWDNTKNPIQLTTGDLVIILPNKKLQEENPREEGVLFIFDHHEKLDKPNSSLWA